MAEPKAEQKKQNKKEAVPVIDEAYNLSRRQATPSLSQNSPKPQLAALPRDPNACDVVRVC